MNPLDQFVFDNFSAVDFNDLRLNRRCHSILSQFSRSDLTRSFPSIFTDPYQLKSFYRFMNNDKVTREKLLSGFHSYLVNSYCDDCDRRSGDETPGYWYLIQDTVFTDFTQRQTLEGSYTQTLKNKGFILHNGLMLDDQLTPKGLLFQQVLHRNSEDFGKSRRKKSRSIEEKESHKWIDGLKAGAAFCKASGARLVHIMDREGDVLDVIKEAAFLGEKFVIRSVHNRNLPQENSKLWDRLRTQSSYCMVERILRDEDGKSYQARCQLKYRTVYINGFQQPLAAVYLKELDTIDHQRKRKEAVEWLLLTNLAVTDDKTAEWVVNIYSARWLIEEFHHCLQSGGCEIETRQFRDDKVLLDCITFLSIPAIKLLLSRYLAHQNPQEPASRIFTDDELEFAEKVAAKYLKPTDLHDSQPQTILRAVILLSRMGGHQGIRQKGLPGYQTLWRGWFKFDQQLQGYLLAKYP